MYRTGSGQAAKSEGNIRIARDRHTATIRSEVSANTASLSPSERAVDSLPISISSVSSPSEPGSAFSSASTFGRASNASNRPHTAGPSHAITSPAKDSSNRRHPEATTRSN